MFALVVVSWGQIGLTKQCFDSLSQHTNEPFKLVWVINEANKEKSEVKELLEYTNRIKLDVHPIFNDRNLGFVRAVNQGVKFALEDADYSHISLLNNDTQVVPNWHSRIVAQMPTDCGAAGPLGDNTDAPQCTKVNEIWQRGHKMRWQPGDHFLSFDQRLQALDHSPALFVPRNVLSYFCVVIPTPVWRKVGLLDERFGFGYGDDNDHSHRIRLAEYRIGIATGVCIHHERGASSKKVFGTNRGKISKHQQKIFDHKWGKDHPPGGYPPNPSLKPYDVI